MVMHRSTPACCQVRTHPLSTLQLQPQNKRAKLNRKENTPKNNLSGWALRVCNFPLLCIYFLEELQVYNRYFPLF